MKKEPSSLEDSDGLFPGLQEKRARVLFIAEAVTLAHVARVHSLAQLLDRDAYEVCIASDPRYDAVMAPHGHVTQTIGSIPSEQFAAALRTGRPLYDLTTLRAYAKDDARVIEAFDPHVVVGDFRLSLNVSARQAGKPFVNVTNAGWSPFAKGPMTVPDLPFTRWFGVSIAQRLFDLARPISFAAHARPLNALRKAHGMPALPFDLRYVYTDADAVLYADLPELFDVAELPARHRFLGPVLWAPRAPDPAWWATLPTDRPLVYLNLGSSGPSDLLATILDALAAAPLTVVAATAGRVAIPHPPANARVTALLDGNRAAARASLVICNGGSPTCYQALAAGKPILGIPTNLDQFLNMEAVARSGAGLLLRTNHTAPPKVAAAVDRLISEPSFERAACRLQTAVGAARPGRELDETLRALIGLRGMRRG